ncbi:ArsR/SmtB family transcription factor [Tahibacter caeni]|uniref:ArsR/SmtB family transcription factor n=1 Tax=Tahibacter caeni TaxID=1453545 RepID=UPI00214788FC|nr:metalloregulator ArsR/SmtB family transcription factor [Tahibacter caeni]
METKAALKALAALAHDSRLAIFRRLVELAPDGAHAGAIGEALGLPGATLSFHLKELHHAGLVESRQEGRFVRYTANLATIQAIVGYLTETCCGGRPEMCAPGPVALPVPTVKRKMARPQ